ncbi:MAG: hypothetical protein ACLGGX_00200 [Bdellovibrionia bacterium]
MPRLKTIKSSLFFAFLIFFGFAIGGFSSGYFVTQSNPKSFASSINKKDQQKQVVAKYGVPLLVYIQSSQPVPQDDAEDFLVYGQFTVGPQLSSTANFEWVIPEGVQVIEGVVSGTYVRGHREKTVNIPLKIRGFKQGDLKFLVFKVSIEGENGWVKNSASFASDIGTTLEQHGVEMKEASDALKQEASEQE